MIWANSVCGARSNFESGPAAMAAAMTGRTPEYGFHLDRHRRGTFLVEVETALDDYAEWGALGKLVGESHQSYFEVPVFTGIRRSPTADELKISCFACEIRIEGEFQRVGVHPKRRPEAGDGGHDPREPLRGHRWPISSAFGVLRQSRRKLQLRVFWAAALCLNEAAPHR